MNQILRRDHDWLPFWHPSRFDQARQTLIQDADLWTVSVRYVTPSGQMAIGPARYSRWRLVALWNGLSGRLQHP